jgi:hypothetical protein
MLMPKPVIRQDPTEILFTPVSQWSILSWSRHFLADFQRRNITDAFFVFHPCSFGFSPSCLQYFFTENMHSDFYESRVFCYVPDNMSYSLCDTWAQIFRI